jgi:hypothetical protein
MTRTQGSGVARTWRPSRSGFSSRFDCSSVTATPEAYVSAGPVERGAACTCDETVTSPARELLRAGGVNTLARCRQPRRDSLPPGIGQADSASAVFYWASPLPPFCGSPATLVFASDTTATGVSQCGYGGLIPSSGLAGGLWSGLSLASSMASSPVERKVPTRRASAPKKRWRRATSPRVVILFTAMAMGALAGLVERATSYWTGFGIGMGLLALLVVVGSPYLFGPLSSPAEIRRIQAEIAEQNRREAETG